MATPVPAVQVFGRKKTAVAVAHCKKGKGMIRVNGQPIELMEPQVLRLKVLEPLLILGRDAFKDVDMRVRVNGGGYTSRVYGMYMPCAGCDVLAIRQAISKALVAYNQKCMYDS